MNFIRSSSSLSLSGKIKLSLHLVQHNAIETYETVEIYTRTHNESEGNDQLDAFTALLPR